MARIGPIAVVAEELKVKSVPLRYAWIGKLRNERDISRAIGIISKIVPGMSHLKRCSAKKLVLGFVSDSSTNENPVDAASTIIRLKMAEFTREEIEKLLTNSNIDLSHFEDEKIDMMKLPAVAPKTKVQAETASKIWPLNFHPDPHLERILDGSCFNAKQLESIECCSRLCIEVALRGNSSGTNECHGSAVVYDPKSDQIVAMAASKINLHPMWHASMIVIDLVAKLGSGGAYELSMKDHHYGESKCSILADEAENFPLAFPMDLLEISSRFNYGDKRPTYTYLCTDYWIFLLREPCSLCAMALLHSRVSNIFYNIANENYGVLGSKALLHEIPGLNHRYGVWKGLCEDESQRAFAEIEKAETADE